MSKPRVHLSKNRTSDRTAHPVSGGTVQDRPIARDGRHAAVQDFFGTHRQAWMDRYTSRSFDARNYRRRADVALKFLQSIAKGRLLEIGCGAGVQADAAYKLGWSVSATDITIPLLIQAHETFTGPHWVASTAEQLPFREATFDAVLMLGVIGYVNDPAVVLRHVHRMLRPDGYLIISWARDHTLMESASKMVSIIPDRLYMTMKEAVRGNSTRTQPGETNSTDPSGTDPSGTDTDTTNFYTAFNRFWNRRDFVELLRTAGFTPEDVQGVNFGQFKFMDHAIWPERIDAALSATFERLSATPGFRRLGNLTRTHVALARRTGMS